MVGGVEVLLCHFFLAGVKKRKRHSPNPVLFCHLFWRGAPVLKRNMNHPLLLFYTFFEKKTLRAEINTVPIMIFMLGLLFSMVRNVIIFKRVTSLKVSLRESSIKYCLCLCIFLCLCHCNCLLVGQVLSPYNSDQMCQRSQISCIALSLSSRELDVL